MRSHASSVTFQGIGRFSINPGRGTTFAAARIALDAVIATAPIRLPSPTNRSELEHFGLDQATMMEEPDARVGQPVPIIRDDGSGFEVHVLPDDAGTHEVEMRELRIPKHDGRLELGSRASHAAAIEPTSARKEASGGDAAIRADDHGPLQQAATLHPGGAMDGDIALDPMIVFQGGKQFRDHGR